MTVKWKASIGGVEEVCDTTPLPSFTLTTPAVLEEQSALVDPTPPGERDQLIPDVSVATGSSREELETVCGGDVSSPAPCT
jgi:hypothetical protein